MTTDETADWARTWIGGSTRDEITVAGRDLPSAGSP